MNKFICFMFFINTVEMSMIKTIKIDVKNRIIQQPKPTNLRKLFDFFD